MYMLPSKMAPITSPLALIRGEPELPGKRSVFDDILKTVFGFSFGWASIHLCVSWNGGCPVARS